MGHAYAPAIVTAVAERAVLLLNHVTATEAVAVRRLRVHAGRCVQVNFPSELRYLPALPAIRLGITPAGLFEWLDSQRVPDPIPDLRVEVYAANPALWVLWRIGGQRPAIEVQGDAGLAADLSWLMDNLRWDIQDDLERIVGRAGAYEIAALGTTLTPVLRNAARALSSWVAGSPASVPPSTP